MIRNCIIALFLITIASVTFAENDDIFDVIAGGAEEYEFIRYSTEEIQLRIKEDMMVACENGLCTLFSITEKSGDQFQVAFNLGYGQAATSTSSEGTSSTGGPFVGLTLSYTHYGECTQNIRVPRSLYIAFQTHMYSLITENGEPERTMMPATEAMMVFFSTIMKQASGCNN